MSPFFHFLHLIIISGEATPAGLAMLLACAEEIEHANAIIVQYVPVFR
jgi:hypothetical protein